MLELTALPTEPHPLAKRERERERDNFKTFFDFVLTAHKMVKPPQKTIE